MTILANHVPKKFLNAHSGNIDHPLAGVWKINYGFFSIFFVDLNKTELEGVDQAFCRDFAQSESFAESLSMPTPGSQKILDILQELIYYRVESFEEEEFKELIMPATMRADVTHIVKPWFEKGRQEGEIQAKLATARMMVKEGDSVEKIARVTGLTMRQLQDIGIIR